MWKAEKIELVKNNKTYSDAWRLYDCSSLMINGTLIHNAVDKDLTIPYPDMFQDGVCSECGQDGCNQGGQLMIKKQGASLIIIPDFNLIETFEEYDFKTEKGDRSCPPHQWYQEGILIVEGEQLQKLYEMMPGLAKETIKEVTAEELDKIIEWERLVREKPKGFMVEE